MYEIIKVLAHIEFYAGENMRQTPFSNGYQPLFDFAHAKTKISGKIRLINVENFSPGSSAIVEITFIKGMISDDYFKKGETFMISEGGKYSLGKGEILDIISSR